MPATLANLVVNPSIETNTTSWSANGGATLTRVSTQHQSGAWSLQVACTAVANSGTQCAAITAGVSQVFTGSVYLRGNTGGETVDVQLRNQAGTVVATLAVTLTTAWQRFTVTGTTPGSTTSVNLRVNKTAATAHTYFLDAAVVTAGAEVWPYFDGDTPGARWTGTAHASSSEIGIGSGPGEADYSYHIDWDGADTVVEQLIFDPSAEGAGDGWQIGTGGTRAIVTTPVRSGSKAMQVTVTSGGIIDLLLLGNPGNVNIPGITVGNRYSAAVWVRSSRAVLLAFRIRWRTAASGGSEAGWSEFTSQLVPANTWTRLVVSGQVAPASATHAVLWANPLWTGVIQVGDVLQFDDAILTETDDAIPYFDGDIGGVWTGTSYASTSEMVLENFSGINDDVTSRLLSDPVAISYGRDSARALSPTAPGQASLMLDNDSGDYYVDNTASPLHGQVIPGRPARIRASIGADTYTLFRGQLDDFTLDPRAKTASFTYIDTLGALTGQRVSTPLYQGLRTGDAIHRLLDALGWPQSQRDIDPGATLIPWWWAEGDAGDELAKLVNSEGPTALVTVNPDGWFVFRDRHHRLLRPASLTSQAVIRVTGSGTWDPLASWPLGYDHGAKAVINDVTFSVDKRMPSGPLASVWTSDSTVSVSDGQVIEITASSSEPFQGAVTPVAGEDYTSTGSGVVSVELTRDSGQSTTIRIHCAGGTATISPMTLRAHPLTVVSSIHVHQEDVASIDVYGRRSWPNEAPWAGVHDALAIAQLVIGQRAQRRPTVAVKLTNYNDLVLIQQLSRDLSDRVTVIDAETGINADFHIEQITHDIHGAGERVHETTFSCEQVPTQVANVFVLGSATRGVLGTNRLGRSGLDDAATVFILGSATNGVLGTNLLGR